MIALTRRRPAYRRLFIQGMNGVRRHIEVAAIPIIGLAGRVPRRDRAVLGDRLTMRLTLFGTRGSVPAPGPETARYGGNTSSVEVARRRRHVLVLDAGTGIRRLGAQLPAASAASTSC